MAFSRADGYGRFFNSTIRECHRWWYRDDLGLPKKRTRGWQVNEVLRTQRRHPRAARDAVMLDHDFGRVDEHRDITGVKV
jgi:hypothetical protein